MSPIAPNMTKGACQLIEMTGATLERIAIARHQVDDSVIHDGLCLIATARAHAGAMQRGAPHGLHRSDIRLVDLIQRRISLVGEIAAVREPSFTRLRGELGGLECRCLADHGLTGKNIRAALARLEATGWRLA